MEGINTHHPEDRACAVCTRAAAVDIGTNYLWEEHGLEMTVTVDLRAREPIVTVVAV